MLFRSFWGRCRSCHHSSSNIKSALRRTLHSPYRCPSYPIPRRAGQAWSTLLTSTAARRHVCSKDEGFYCAVTFREQEAAPGLSLSLNYLAQPFKQHIQQVSIKEEGEKKQLRWDNVQVIMFTLRNQINSGLQPWRLQQGHWLTWHRSAWIEVSWFVFICILSIACFRTTTPLKGCQRRGEKKRNIQGYSAADFLSYPKMLEAVQACSSLWKALKNLEEERERKKRTHAKVECWNSVKYKEWDDSYMSGRVGKK